MIAIALRAVVLWSVLRDIDPNLKVTLLHLKGKGRCSKIWNGQKKQWIDGKLFPAEARRCCLGEHGLIFCLKKECLCPSYALTYYGYSKFPVNSYSTFFIEPFHKRALRMDDCMVSCYIYTEVSKLSQFTKSLCSLSNLIMVPLELVVCVAQMPSTAVFSSEI